MAKKLTKLDPGFKPAILALREYEAGVKKAAATQELTLCLERTGGYNYFYKMQIYADGTGHDEENYEIVERLAKGILWMVGGYKLYVAGSNYLAERLAEDYLPFGRRAFDYDFMSTVYERKFEIVSCLAKDLPKPHIEKQNIQHNLKGCRIGFDAGGSDRKVAAVKDGEVIFTDETVWFPKIHSDPEYQKAGILESIKMAASYLPRVDAIGVSSAGVCVNNKIMLSSLFLQVPKEKYGQVKTVYIDVAKEVAPDAAFVLANDGDVTAYAGALDLKADCVLGIAMGTSEAGGYIGTGMQLAGWLNELAFVPIDFNKGAMIDEWSGDYGCGVKYFSQDGVIKLAEAGGIKFDPNMSPARRLKIVQDMLEEGSEIAEEIFTTLGIYLGYTIPYYAHFYEIKHLLLLGRVVSGRGGNIIIAKAREVLYSQFPELAGVMLHMPDEKSRRVGQAIAAASLPNV